jgi:hypothetical protein
MVCGEPSPTLTVAQMGRERTVLATQELSTATSYDRGSDAGTTAATTAATIRRHRLIEHQRHWVLDLACREDDARQRARHTAQNLTTRCHFARNIITQDRERTLGVANSRTRAGGDRDYRLTRLTAVEG